MEKFKDVLIAFALASFAVFAITGATFFLIRIDECKLEETRYCPSCGIDLVNH